VDSPNGESKIHVANSSASAVDKEKRDLEEMLGDGSRNHNRNIKRDLEEMIMLGDGSKNHNRNKRDNFRGDDHAGRRK
jgi:hypothetical protein